MADRLVAKVKAASGRLDLSHGGVTDDNARAVAQAIKENARITSVCLSDNEITDDGAAAFAEMLESNRVLTEIDFSLNDICDDGAVALARAVRRNRTLLVLILDDTDIGNVGVQELLEAVKSNPTLTRLSLKPLSNCSRLDLIDQIEWKVAENSSGGSSSSSQTAASSSSSSSPAAASSSSSPPAGASSSSSSAASSSSPSPQGTPPASPRQPPPKRNFFQRIFDFLFAPAPAAQAQQPAAPAQQTAAPAQQPAVPVQQPAAPVQQPAAPAQRAAAAPPQRAAEAPKAAAPPPQPAVQAPAPQRVAAAPAQRAAEAPKAAAPPPQPAVQAPAPQRVVAAPKASTPVQAARPAPTPERTPDRHGTPSTPGSMSLSRSDSTANFSELPLAYPQQFRTTPLSAMMAAGPSSSSSSSPSPSNPHGPTKDWAQLQKELASEFAKEADPSAFKIITVLGNGSNGFVFFCDPSSASCARARAIWKKFHGDCEFKVALKACLPLHQSTNSARQAFAVELAALREVPLHPNIISLWSEFITEPTDNMIKHYEPAELQKDVFYRVNARNRQLSKWKTQFVVMERHPRTLENLILGGNVTLRTIVDLSLQLGEALLHLWVHDFVHLDVKQDNILLASDGRVVLADFGCAVKLSAFQTSPPRRNHIRFSKEYTAGGNMLHLCPELTACRRALKGDVDMSGQPSWELGCIMLEMALKEFPFPDYGNTGRVEALDATRVRLACERINTGSRQVSPARVGELAGHMCALVHPSLKDRLGIEEAVHALRQLAN